MISRLAHIVNPVQVEATSDLFVAQPITFKTMQIAQAVASDRGLTVDLFTTQYEEERSLIPDGFIKTPNLERSVLDCGKFNIPRKLPLIKDILDRLYAATDANYLIYTNVDIALMPHFYWTVAQLIEQGYDAFTINRRTLSKDYQTVSEIPLMYAQLGDSHPGHDCFVFPREVYPHYHLGQLCLGASLIDRGLLTNMICHARKFREFKTLHLTFHLGDDRIWRQQDYSDYTLHNLAQINQILDIYRSQGKLVKHQLINRTLKNQDLKYWFGADHYPKTWKSELRAKLRGILQKLADYLQP